MSTATLEELLIEQEFTGGLIQRFWENLKRVGKANLTQAVLQTRLNTLNEYWKQVLERHLRIIKKEGASKTTYVTEDRFAQLEEARLVTAAKIAELLSGASTAAQGTPPTNEKTAVTESAALYRQIQLPKITLPTFNGDQLLWENFRDLFKSLASLSGEAAELLKNVPLTESEYSGAWSELLKRYDNKRLLLFTHMRNLLNCPGTTKSAPAEIKRLLCVTNQAIRAFKALGRPVEHWDDWLVHIFIHKLDASTRMHWETSLADSREFPEFSQLSEFLETRARALEAANAVSAESRNSTHRETGQGGSRKPRAAVHVTTTGAERAPHACPLCKGNHSLGYCNRFRRLSPSKRLEQASRLKVCQNCLRIDHQVDDCQSERRCLTCSNKHHTFLHGSMSSTRAAEMSTSTASASTEPRETTANPSVSLHTIKANETVLLATARIQLESPRGHKITERALLDPGADVSVVSEAAAQALRLDRQRVRRPIFGAQNVYTGTATTAVELTIRSRRSPECRIPFRALVLRTLTGVTPLRKVTLHPSWGHLTDLDLADPEFATPGKIDVIIGADVYGVILENGLRQGTLESPTAQLTVFGWVLFGTADHHSEQPGKANVNMWLSQNDPTDELLRRFWEVKEVQLTSVPTEDDKYCESHYQDTHTRDATGRYVVRLPVREEVGVTLGPTRQAAVSVLLHQERRRDRTKLLRQRYIQFMDEYLELDHMRPVPEYVPQGNSCYLLHHAVMKAHDPEGKIRVVFDASFKSPTGQSLNDLLFAGPKLQTDLWIVLMRWRFYRLAITTDIVKMFRQIRVHPADQDWQRIVWRSDPSEALRDFRLTTVTYGTAPASFLALRTLRQLATDEQERFPLGAAALNNNAYVDDILTGADDEDTFRTVQRQLTELLRAGGFELSKWASNRPELIPEACRSDKCFDLEEGSCTLGLRWNPSTDSFRLRVNSSRNCKMAASKRGVLSVIARLYDPLGWAAPVLIQGKVFLQNLWLRGLAWDEELPSDLTQTWTRFHSTLADLENFRIPRWIGTRVANTNGITLHGFCDASQRAYAAAIFLRTTEASGLCNSHLLVAKTKVAPVRTVSIPRLELCGAVLLARLMAILRRDLRLEEVPVVAWTDSAVVLAWIRSHASRWKPFVANRVAEIQATLPAFSWRHVGTSNNPADIATKGVTPSELCKLNMWWQGPPWLTGASSTWAAAPVDTVGLGLQEQRAAATVLVATTTVGDEFLARYSSLTRLTRISALCLRFAHNLRHAADRRTGYLTSEELSTALNRWILVVQQRDFADEITALAKNKTEAIITKLRNLRPILDEQGIHRVGGRLHEAHLSFDERHPIILAKSCPLSLLLVRDAHHTTLHGGPQLTRSHLLRKFWVIQGNSLVRDVICSCVRCARFRMKTGEQCMGQLPVERTTPTRPFLNTGVDYAGPVALRVSKGRGVRSYKGYICLFVCLASKAVHLEVVSDLSSAVFLAAFKRFVSRRGRCVKMLSDNGTCFRGADAELRTLFKAASAFYQEVCAALANDGTSWSFIPPYAPHFGGLWEAGVKAVKYHLRRVIGDHKLTYEELSTLLCQIEACLNSRPLYPISNDPSDLAALTPGHLLIGEPPIAIPEPSSLDVNPHSLTRWTLLTNMRDHFWHRWSREYLHHLQSTNKWQRTKESLMLGSLVLIKDDSLPPAKWAMGRVAKLHYGSDGLVRVATLKTTKGFVKRPLIKICPLPVPTEALS